MSVEIKASDNGPYLVTGPIALLDGGGRPRALRKSTIALCRCGGSGNKPFCDGTHSRRGFAATERAVADADA